MGKVLMKAIEIHKALWSAIAMIIVLATLAGGGYAIFAPSSPVLCTSGLSHVYYTITKHYDDSYTPSGLIGITNAPALLLCKNGETLTP